MGEYEPNDSRNITLTNDNAPGEPPRTGPREGETRPGDTRAEGEKGVRAAPQPGTTVSESRGGGPIDEGLVQPSSTPQASQSQWQGGQSQTMGGMSQSMGGIDQQALQPSASHQSDARPEQFGEAQLSHGSPSQHENSPSASSGAGWAADFPSAGAEAASGHSIKDPQNMHQGDPETERTRREQAEGQGGPDAPKGFGYGAEEGEEMSDAPDVSDPEERGYGGGGEERIEKLERDR